MFHVHSGTLDGGAQKTAISKAAKDLAKLPDVVSAPSPFSQQGAAGLSKDKATAFIPVLLRTSSADLTESEAGSVLDTAERAAEGTGMEVAAGRLDRLEAVEAGDREQRARRASSPR